MEGEEGGGGEGREGAARCTWNGVALSGRG